MTATGALKFVPELEYLDFSPLTDDDIRRATEVGAELRPLKMSKNE